MPKFVQCEICNTASPLGTCSFAVYRAAISGEDHVFCCPVMYRKFRFDRTAINCEEKVKKTMQEKDLAELLKQLPPPPQEHAYELKMEKRLKRLLKDSKQPADNSQ